LPEEEAPGDELPGANGFHIGKAVNGVESETCKAAFAGRGAAARETLVGGSVARARRPGGAFALPPALTFE
jgi:hypothetical protein